MWLVVGLGNPGGGYAQTRHNIGFHVLDLLRERAGADAPREKFGGELAQGQLGSERVVLLKPMEFMNLSGQAVGKASAFYKVPLERVLVLHDEIDLPFSHLRVAAGGGHGGHNGLRSIIAHLSGNAFPRVRIGVGRPPAGRDAAQHVLDRFTAAERTALPPLLERAAEAAATVIARGPTAAMNAFNAPPRP